MFSAFNIILIILGVLVFWAIVIFNGFVRLKNRAKEAWSDIEVQLKRRFDLIPNLLETVKGYAAHESGVFERVTQARTAAIAAGKNGDIKQAAAAENALSGTLKTLFAVSENYPELKANGNFLELQRELSDTENKIQASRRFYNTTVRDLNTKAESFPSSVIAGIFKFKQMEFFDIDEAPEAKEPVKVAF